jgi:hypothetical protein
VPEILGQGALAVTAGSQLAFRKDGLAQVGQLFNGLNSRHGKRSPSMKVFGLGMGITKN